MHVNELQHYGVKGMKWKQHRTKIQKASNKSSKKVNFSTAPRGGGFTPGHHAGESVPGQPYMVYTGDGDSVMMKNAYEAMKDPHAYEKAVLNDLPGDIVNAGQDFLDDLFGVKRKK